MASNIAGAMADAQRGDLEVETIRLKRFRVTLEDSRCGSVNFCDIKAEDAGDAIALVAAGMHALFPFDVARIDPARQPASRGQK